VGNEHWRLAAAAVAEVRQLCSRDIDLEGGKLAIVREIAKNRTERQPRAMALGEWGLRNLFDRARGLEATAPTLTCSPLSLSKSCHSKDAKRKCLLLCGLTVYEQSRVSKHVAGKSGQGQCQTR
jgi:hypothetical protein